MNVLNSSNWLPLVPYDLSLVIILFFISFIVESFVLIIYFKKVKSYKPFDIFAIVFLANFLTWVIGLIIVYTQPDITYMATDNVVSPLPMILIITALSVIIIMGVKKN